jgi:hypothetical protein
MSRKSKCITIDGRGEITVKEVSPWAVYSVFTSKEKEDKFLGLLAECMDKPFEEVRTWYASELKQVIDGFMEVNDSFLDIAGKLGVEQMLRQMIAGIVADLPELYAASYRQAMAQGPGTTAGASS